MSKDTRTKNIYFAKNKVQINNHINELYVS